MRLGKVTQLEKLKAYFSDRWFTSEQACLVLGISKRAFPSVMKRLKLEFEGNNWNMKYRIKYVIDTHT